MQLKKIPDSIFLEVFNEYNFIDSPFIPIPSNVGIIVEMKYPLLGMKNAIDKCLVRKEVLDLLLEAKKLLPNHLTFKIWDAYRPLELQRELYYKYKEKIIKEFNLEELSKKEQDEIIKNYVSLPKEDEIVGPLHSTGGALDLTLTDINTGKDLDMGIEFDDFSDLTNTNAFEKEGMDKNIRDNRRILYTVMTEVGFTNLPSEIWHYDYGDRAWAFYNNEPALYKGIFKLEEIGEYKNE